MKRIAGFFALCAAMGSGQSPFTLSDPNYKVDTIATGLAIPIGFEFLGPNDLIVCEKNTGLVKRFVNSVYVGNVLDLPVQFSGERGLMGIALDPQFTTNGYAYVYYCRSDVDGGTYLGTRIERYEWNGSALVNPYLVWELLPDPSLGDGNHHIGGILRFGPDGKLYASVGEMFRQGKDDNFPALPFCHTAGIMRLNPDGSTPADNPFVGSSDAQFQRWFAYGMRNVFGMDFEPYTGALWCTDNSDNFYDEFNIVPSGMNGGWKLLSGPLSHSGVSTSSMYMPSGAQYVDPIFSWYTSVGIVAIGFIHSARFPTAVRDKMLTNDNNRQNLYLMPIATSRDGFDLTGGNADGVADTETERNVFKWGDNWGANPEIKVGPDGFMYLDSVEDGKVVRIRPLNPLNQLRGHVSLGSYVGIPASIPITIQIRSGPTVVQTENTLLDAYGNYIMSPSVTGSYDVWVKAANWLAVLTPAVTLGANTTLDVALPVNGDAFDDNQVDLFDVNIILSNFGDVAPDLDGNGAVDLFDLNLTFTGFAQVGDP